MTDPDTPERERTPYQPDNQSLRMMLGALAVGALVGIGVIVLFVTL